MKIKTTTAIRLGGGHEAVIDCADIQLVAGFKWRPLQSTPSLVYAHAWHGDMHLYMHRLIAGAGPDKQVDHANGDGLDNRLLNLRLATRSQNQANRGKQRGRGRAESTSPYKGVYWDTTRRRWSAMITVDGKRIGLGRFDSEEAAGRAYDLMALGAWGMFARLNFP